MAKPKNWNPKSWADEAWLVARDNFEDNFKSRQGVGEIGPHIYVYSNNPTVNRDEEIAGLIAYMAAAGYPVVARASYDDGYSLGIIFDGRQGREEGQDLVHRFARRQRRPTIWERLGV